MIYWDLLLENTEVTKALRDLYNHAQSIHEMAEFLGVSITCLRRKLTELEIPVRLKHDNVPVKNFPPTADPLLTRYTVWILRKRGIKTVYRRNRSKGAFETSHGKRLQAAREDGGRDDPGTSATPDQHRPSRESGSNG
jgi:hypothetical protein